jgi:hypothetical protein
MHKQAAERKSGYEKAPALVAPALAEGSFEQCPDVRLSDCHTYEYNRSSDLICETVRRRRAGEVDALTESVFLLFPFTSYWMLDSPWWPGKPCLEIRAEEWKCHLIQPEAVHSAADLIDPSTNFNMTRDRLVLLRLAPGRLTLTMALRATRALLLRDHADLFCAPLKGQGRSKRGRGSYPEQARADLKALFAWRLKKRGYTAREAIALAESLRLNTYSGPQAYCRAVKRAQEVIDYREDLLRQFAAKKEASK